MSASTVSATAPAGSTTSTAVRTRPAGSRGEPAAPGQHGDAFVHAAATRCRRTAAGRASLMRSLTDARSTATSPATVPTPTRGASRKAVTRSLVAISVLLGTQSVSTHDAADAVAVDDGHLGAELRGDQRRLVAGRAAADDHDASHASIVHRDLSPVPPTRRHLGTLPCDVFDGWPLRGVRLQHGSRADARALPALARGRYRLAQRLAAHLRRRGTRLGRRAGHGRARPGQPGLRRALRRLAAGPRQARLLGRRRRRVSTTRSSCGSRRSTGTCSPGCTSSTRTRAGCRRRATSG